MLLQRARGAIVLLVPWSLACGGIAIIDPDSSGGSGGTGGFGGATSTSTSVTQVSTSVSSVVSTSTGPVACNGFEECCTQLCDLLETGPCPIDGCDCSVGGFEPECEAAFVGWYQCLVGAYPASITCVDGGPVPACGTCDAEQQKANDACGFGFFCQ